MKKIYAPEKKPEMYTTDGNLVAVVGTVEEGIHVVRNVYMEEQEHFNNNNGDQWHYGAEIIYHGTLHNKAPVHIYSCRIADMKKELIELRREKMKLTRDIGAGKRGLAKIQEETAVAARTVDLFTDDIWMWQSSSIEPKYFPGEYTKRQRRRLSANDNTYKIENVMTVEPTPEQILARAEERLGEISNDYTRHVFIKSAIEYPHKSKKLSALIEEAEKKRRAALLEKTENEYAAAKRRLDAAISKDSGDGKYG